jgi:hypothetical protein
VRNRHSVSKEHAVGARIVANANPEAFGGDDATVILSNGCFHSYTYRMDDPTNQMGADEGEFVVLVPVDTQTTAWSAGRYNAYAKATGRMPVVSVPHEVGNPKSYSSTPVRGDGTPVADSEMVFRDRPTLTVSDRSMMGWWLTTRENVTNEVALDTRLSMSGNVSVPGFHFGTEVGQGWSHGYGIAVGEHVLFGGSAPPLPDDVSTPEDEHSTHRYSFSPYVYREHYTDAAGKDAAYYAINFTVGQ